MKEQSKDLDESNLFNDQSSLLSATINKFDQSVIEEDNTKEDNTMMSLLNKKIKKKTETIRVTKYNQIRLVKRRPFVEKKLLSKLFKDDFVAELEIKGDLSVTTKIEANELTDPTKAKDEEIITELRPNTFTYVYLEDYNKLNQYFPKKLENTQVVETPTDRIQNCIEIASRKYSRIHNIFTVLIEVLKSSLKTISIEAFTLFALIYDKEKHKINKTGFIKELSKAIREKKGYSEKLRLNSSQFLLAMDPFIDMIMKQFTKIESDSKVKAFFKKKLEDIDKDIDSFNWKNRNWKEFLRFDYFDDVTILPRNASSDISKFKSLERFDIFNDLNLLMKTMDFLFINWSEMSNKVEKEKDIEFIDKAKLQEYKIAQGMKKTNRKVTLQALQMVCGEE